LIGASQQTEILFAAQFAQESDAGGRAVTGAEAVGRNAGGVAGEIGNRQLAAAGGGDQHVVVAHERVHLLHQLETDAVGVEVVHRRVEVGHAKGVGPGGGVGNRGLHQLVAS